VQHDSEGLSLERVLGVLRRRLPLIVLCAVVVAGAAFGFSKHKTKKYTATASLAFTVDSLSQEIAGLPGNSSNSLLSQQASNLELVRLGDMAAKTAELLGHGLTAAKVADSLTVKGAGESSVVDVSVTATSPVLAASIANTYTQQFVKEQQAANRQYFKAALSLVHKQLAALSPKQRIGGDGLQLQDRAQTLGFLAELNNGNVQVAEEAVAPTSPSSPKTSKDTVLGGLLGLLIGLGLALVVERLDRRIRGLEELEHIYGLPMLGVVPNSAALSHSGRGKGGARTAIPPADAEVFSLIRAHLRFFNVNRDVRTIIIASPAPNDGKTTIALHLAEAAARLGSRTLLLEVDLRQPTLTQLLNIQADIGLAAVLIGAVRMDEAIQSVNLQPAQGAGTSGHMLDLLAAGTVLPPNPAELIESQAMDALLAQARSAYDLVVIDTPPLTAVSDAFPLLTKVDGVVIVGWVGRSRRDAAEQLHHVLASSGAPLLGVIGNGAKSPGDPGVYASASKHAPQATLTTANNSATTEGLTPTAKV
jgi:capsular exopolysaccharide synthesis family protein